jgi:hypothetical protein
MKSGEVSFRQQEFLKEVVDDPDFMDQLLVPNEKKLVRPNNDRLHKRNQSGINFFEVESRNSYEVVV